MDESITLLLDQDSTDKEMTKVHMSNGASNKWIGDEYSQLLVEQIAVMVSKEKTCTDYLSGFPKMNTDYLIDEVWRQKAAEWMFKVIDFYVSSNGLCVPVYSCL